MYLFRFHAVPGCFIKYGICNFDPVFCIFGNPVIIRCLYDDLPLCV